MKLTKECHEIVEGISTPNIGSLKKDTLARLMKKNEERKHPSVYWEEKQT